jgi:hypothetical protein
MYEQLERTTSGRKRPLVKVSGDLTRLARQLAWLKELDHEAVDELVDRLDDPRLMRRFGDASPRRARMILAAIGPRHQAPVVRSVRSRSRERRAGTHKRTRSSRGPPGRSSDDEPPPPDLERPRLTAELRAYLRAAIDTRRRELLVEQRKADLALFAGEGRE